MPASRRSAAMNCRAALPVATMTLASPFWAMAALMHRRRCSVGRQARLVGKIAPAAGQTCARWVRSTSHVLDNRWAPTLGATVWRRRPTGRLCSGDLSYRQRVAAFLHDRIPHGDDILRMGWRCSARWWSPARSRSRQRRHAAPGVWPLAPHPTDPAARRSLASMPPTITSRLP